MHKKIAKFENPHGVCVDHASDVLIADSYSHCIRKVRLTDGFVTTIVGNWRSTDHCDRYRLDARLGRCSRLGIMRDGRIVVVDNDTSTIRLVDPTLQLRTTLCGRSDIKAFANGLPHSTPLEQPSGED